jgi:hypothetical protein
VDSKEWLIDGVNDIKLVVLVVSSRDSMLGLRLGLRREAPRSFWWGKSCDHNPQTLFNEFVYFLILNVDIDQLLESSPPLQLLLYACSSNSQAAARPFIPRYISHVVTHRSFERPSSYY